MKLDALKQIAAASERGETSYLELSAGKDSYCRKFVPRERLIVLGGGHISQPVCRIASMLEFAVTVVDDRPLFANYERFPDAAEVICEEFRKAIQELHIRENDYVCVITRGHQWDGECLREILSGQMPSYLGMIGSRRRVKGLYDVLEKEGYSRMVLESIHSPIGLSIQAVTPAEIGVSICAELVAHRRSAVAKSGPNMEEKPVLEQTDVNRQMLDFAIHGDTPKAIMTVIGTKGSTPAPSGAMMVIDVLGVSKGTIGGGCSEAEVIGLARRIAAEGGCEIANIDMTNEAAAQEGMACGGTMEVLVEAIERPAEL